MTTTRIRFIRHAESEANAGLATIDPATIALTAAGHEQARLLAHSFSVAPDAIYYSPYVRAHDTARELMRRYPNVPATPIELQEFTFLDPVAHRGTTQVQRVVPVATYWERADPLHVDGPSAESFLEFAYRVQRALQRLRQESMQHGWTEVVVFCHEQVIRMIGQSIASQGGALVPPDTIEDMRRFHATRFERVDNCQGIAVTCSGDFWERAPG